MIRERRGKVIAGTGQIAFRAQLVVPEQRQLYDYWLERSSDRAMPDRRDIHPAHFPRLLPNISLIEIDPLNGGCRIRLAGTRLRDVFDREITGLSLDDIDFGEKRDYWMAAYQRTIEEGKPTQGVVRGPRVNKEHLVQYWLKLPLCRDGGPGVGMILCLDHLQSAAEDQMLLPQATG
ncbi:MAG: PAS domain-containing protein [Rhizobiales bacterium]|nr:PAS domain-containing protein [Hyphomicrobiales bacterium]MBI3673716.1 PAS domain-containing protein [Hyphomicrobiales bacterium]